MKKLLVIAICVLIAGAGDAPAESDIKLAKEIAQVEVA